MKAMYNRETKNLWIQHDDGSVDELGTAATKLIAYDKVAEAGYIRSTDWRLCGGWNAISGDGDYAQTYSVTDRCLADHVPRERRGDVER